MTRRDQAQASVDDVRDDDDDDATPRRRPLRLVDDGHGLPGWRQGYLDRSLADVCRVILDEEPEPPR
jgi:hypothetical protein